MLKRLFSLGSLLFAITSAFAGNGSDLPRCDAQFSAVPCVNSKTVRALCIPTNGSMHPVGNIDNGTYMGYSDIQQVSCDVRVTERCDQYEGVNSIICSTIDAQVDASGF